MEMSIEHLKYIRETLVIEVRAYVCEEEFAGCWFLVLLCLRQFLYSNVLLDFSFGVANTQVSRFVINVVLAWVTVAEKSTITIATLLKESNQLLTVSKI